MLDNALLVLSPSLSSKKLGSGLPPSLHAEVSPNLAEFTQRVSNPGAQIA